MGDTLAGRVDVVSVWHNRERLVERSVGSLIEQDLSGFRLIAVDDGSTDATGARLEEMRERAAARGLDMVVWHKPNEGFTRSIRRAIAEKSDAGFIAIHGAGDISHPRRLSAQRDLMLADAQIAIVGCAINLCDEAGRVLRARRPATEPRRDAARLRIPRPGSHGAAMLRRRHYDLAGGYRDLFRYAQDADLWLRMSRFGKVRNLSDILYDKLGVSGSVSRCWKRSAQQHKYSTLALQSAIAVDRGLPDPVDSLDPGRWEQAVDGSIFARRVLPGALKAMVEGDWGKAAGWTGEALRMWRASLGA